MSKTIEELIKEVMADEKLRDKLISDMTEPAQVAEFLKAHGCNENVNDFITALDKYN